MRNRSAVLELAVLGLLHTGPLHGYELRKRLNLMLGPLRAFSYGSLYPCLKTLQADGFIDGVAGTTMRRSERLSHTGRNDNSAGGQQSRRSKIVYHLTSSGSNRLEKLLGEAGPASWEDENFDIRFAFFTQTDRSTRLRVLEGRRARMAERLDTLFSSAQSSAGSADPYLLELQHHWHDQTERELHWLDKLIANEHAGENNL